MGIRKRTSSLSYSLVKLSPVFIHVISPENIETSNIIYLLYCNVKTVDQIVLRSNHIFEELAVFSEIARGCLAGSNFTPAES